MRIRLRRYSDDAIRDFDTEHESYLVHLHEWVEGGDAYLCEMADQAHMKSKWRNIVFNICYYTGIVWLIKSTRLMNPWMKERLKMKQMKLDDL